MTAAAAPRMEPEPAAAAVPLSVVGANCRADRALASIAARIGSPDPQQPVPPPPVGLLHGPELPPIVTARLDADGTLDLIGHATGIRSILKVGEWVIDDVGGEQLAGYLRAFNGGERPRVKRVRLLGCGTGRNGALLDRIRTRSVVRTRAGEFAPEVLGPLGRIWAKDFGREGFREQVDLRAGAVLARGVPRWATVMGVTPVAGYAGTASGWGRRATRIAVWLALVASLIRAVLTGRGQAFRRLQRFEQQVGRQLGGGEAQPGLLTEPLAVARWQHRGVAKVLEILFEYGGARLYEEGAADAGAEHVFDIAGRADGAPGQVALRAILEAAPPDVSWTVHPEYALLAPLAVAAPSAPAAGRASHLKSVAAVIAAIALIAGSAAAAWRLSSRDRGERPGTGPVVVLPPSHVVHSGTDAGEVAPAAIDASANDANTGDVAMLDAGTTPMAVVDAMVVDATVVDAMVVDATVIDATVIDPTVIDAAVFDASVVDAHKPVHGPAPMPKGERSVPVLDYSTGGTTPVDGGGQLVDTGALIDASAPVDARGWEPGAGPVKDPQWPRPRDPPPDDRPRRDAGR